MQKEINSNIRLQETNSKNLFGKPDKYDYQKYKELKDFDWDDELADKFFPIAKELNLSQESLEMLLEIALEMAKKQKTLYEKSADEKYLEDVNNFNKMFTEDEDLPNVNSIQIKNYMEIANSAYSDFTTPKLKEILEKTGLVYHPELIKMFYKIGELSKEDNLSHCGKPTINELTPAQILYGKNN